MKITGILHRAGGSLNDLFRNISKASDEGADIVIAPDYALVEDLSKPLDRNELSAYRTTLEQISYRHSNLIIPGTFPVKEDSKMVLECPVFFRGKNIKNLHKETDRGEAELARANGLEYVRGNCSENYFDYGGRNVAVEICSDHGHQTLPQNTFLEVILAYDQKAGFWSRIGTSKSARHILVCDSFAPKVEGSYFDEAGKLNCWKPIIEDSERRVYEIK